MSKKVRILGAVIGGVALLAIGLVSGYFLASKKYMGFVNSIRLVRDSDKSEPFVGPLLGITTPDALSIGQFNSLSTEVKNALSSDGSVLDRYSVYFRDLNNGLWFGINEDDTYNPASMLKVALAIGAYKQAEADPSFLSQPEMYTPELAAVDTDQANATPSELRVGQSYTVNDLLEKMLVDSDNGAKDILGNTVDEKISEDVYTNLGMKIPPDTGTYLISARQYGLFFSRLYNSSYLSPEDSNALLGLLSQATFKSGLVAGVPSIIPIAHKFGEYVVSDDNSIDSLELHDCGIIYDPKHPYELCVMTQGKDESDLSNVIATVSKTVYTEVEKDYH